jgi:hypothetical protein
VIRQAISCDICGTEKRQTNHWFVVYEQAGELRVSAWGAQGRLRPSTRHLCGQTCLHKLVDDFMARSVAARVHAASAAEVDPESSAMHTSIAPTSACDEIESSARLLTPLAPALVARTHPSPANLVSGPEQVAAEAAALPSFEPPRYASRSWHAEAWERERAREMRAAAHHVDTARRRSSA